MNKILLTIAKAILLILLIPIIIFSFVTIGSIWVISFPVLYLKYKIIKYPGKYRNVFSGDIDYKVYNQLYKAKKVFKRHEINIINADTIYEINDDEKLYILIDDIIYFENDEWIFINDNNIFVTIREQLEAYGFNKDFVVIIAETNFSDNDKPARQAFKSENRFIDYKVFCKQINNGK